MNETGEAMGGGTAIEAANRRIAALIRGLPAYDDAAFWSRVEEGERLAPEVLVHITRAFRGRGDAVGIERASDLLIAWAYPIAAGIVRRTLLSRPQDHEDAVRDTLKVMWERVADGTPFWERNALGALHAACISACRMYLAKKRSAVPFAVLDGPGGADGPGFAMRLPDENSDRGHDAIVGAATYDQLLSLLDPPLREVATLIAEGGLTQRQIAHRLGCTEKTVYNRLGKVRDRLAATYEEMYR